MFSVQLVFARFQDCHCHTSCPSYDTNPSLNELYHWHRRFTTACLHHDDGSGWLDMSQPNSASSHNYNGILPNTSRRDSPSPRNATEIPLRPYYNHPSTENEHRVNDSRRSMPKYDKANRTRLCCMAATCLGIILASIFTTAGCYLMKKPPTNPSVEFLLPPIQKKVLFGAANLIVSLCIVGMSYVHSVSLRWALYDEGRLSYNTNLRLFTCSKKRGPNRWYVNLSLCISLALSYGSISTLLVHNLIRSSTVTQLPSILIVEPHGMALVVLGIALGVQAGIAVWCLVSCRHSILTWSSNPLNTTLAMIQNGGMTRRPGRCLLSVHQRHQWPNQFVYPTERQGSIMDAVYATRYIILTLGALPVFAILLAIATIIAAYLTNGEHGTCWRFGLKWELDPSPCSKNLIFLDVLQHARIELASTSYALRTTLHILLLSLVQGAQAIALHCMELIVNLSRDESIWQKSYNYGAIHSAAGAQLFANPLREAVSSPATVILFIAKIALPWTLSQGIFIMLSPIAAAQGHVGSGGTLLGVAYFPLIIYTGLSMACFAFATFLAKRHPRSYQPSTLGHIQTLADLIDDWETDSNGRLWWGDKTSDWDSNDNVRYAGTSSKKEFLSFICSSGEYR